jgi:hypothetical protein
VRSRHSNLPVLWSENLYSLLFSGLNLVGCRCVHYGQTRFGGLWTFGRVERAACKVSRSWGGGGGLILNW